MKDKSKNHQMVLIGIMTAVICVFGPLAIPIGLVPLSLTNLSIYFVIYVIGMKKGTLSCLLYLLIGLVGIPVFSGFTGGPGKLLGPTGGYLIGFVFMAIISGYFIDKFIDKWYFCFLGMVLSTAVLYLFGTYWLARQASIPMASALSVGVIPFIVGDLAKISIVALFGPKIRKRLFRANLIK